MFQLMFCTCEQKIAYNLIWRFCINTNCRELYRSAKKTKAEFILEGYTVIDETAADKMLDNYQNEMCGDWQEISEENYEEMMNVLPPARYYNGGFYVPEAIYGNCYGYYQEWQGKYYTSVQRLSTPREEIIESLRKFVGEENV